MSQSINLGNVGTVSFNGSNIEAVNLNGSQIWAGIPSAIVTAGIYSVVDDKVVSDRDFIGFERLAPAYGSMSPYNPYQGFNVASLIEFWFPDTGVASVLFRVYGTYPKNAVTSLSINGYTFYTAQPLSGGEGDVNGTGHVNMVASEGTFTQWMWKYPAGLRLMNNGATNTVKIG
jgi:hypothetical protein